MQELLSIVTAGACVFTFIRFVLWMEREYYPPRRDFYRRK